MAQQTYIQPRKLAGFWELPPEKQIVFEQMLLGQQGIIDKKKEKKNLHRITTTYTKLKQDESQI